MCLLWPSKFYSYRIVVTERAEISLTDMDECHPEVLKEVNIFDEIMAFATDFCCVGFDEDAILNIGVFYVSSAQHHFELIQWISGDDSNVFFYGWGWAYTVHSFISNQQDVGIWWVMNWNRTGDELL